MDLKHYKTIRINNKNVHILNDDNNSMYYEHKYNAANANVINLIQSISKENENLTTILDIYKKENESFYITNVDNNRPLSNLIENEYKLSAPQITTILVNILQSVKLLHDKNIIHGELNTDTLFIDKHKNIIINNYDNCFDVSNVVNFEINFLSKFVAPELYSFKNIKFYTDIYSVGKILSELISYQDLEVSSQFTSIVDKCCSYDFNKRYQSVDELLNFLLMIEQPFFSKQVEQISDAQNLGLTEEQINAMSLMEYTSKQMGVIKHAYDENIDQDTIDLLSNKEFTSRQMYQIMRGSKDGLIIEEIKKYAKPYFTPEEMAIYRTALINEFSIKEIYDRLKMYKFFVESSNLDDEQQTVLRYAFYNKINNTNIKVLLNDNLSSEIMKEIANLLIEKDK